MALTDRAAKAVKPREKPYKLADGKGLYLLIIPKHRKYWRLKYRIGDKEKLLALGSYPDVSIAEARTARDAAKKLIQSWHDPIYDQETGTSGRSDFCREHFRIGCARMDRAATPLLDSGARGARARFPQGGYFSGYRRAPNMNGNLRMRSGTRSRPLAIAANIWMTVER